MQEFTPYEGINQIAEAYALDAIDAARNNFGITLDWSVESIQHVEIMLGRLHQELPRVKPPDSTIITFAKMFGSYVGEVIRRKHGGEWGIWNLDGQEVTGLSHGIWPWARAHKRITIGPEENIWHYYLLIFERGAAEQVAAADRPPGGR